MKKITTTLLTAMLLLIAVSAFAANLRSPQVVFDSGPLQGYFTGIETFNLASDQVDAQVWSTNITGNSDFTLTLKNGVADEIGVYNSIDPAANEFMVFPSGAGSGWFAQMHFGATNLLVTLYDNNGVSQGQTNFAGVNKSSFGFYVKSVNGTYFSQDYRNGRPMVLTYAGVSNPGDWWVCFQDVAYPLSSSTFDSAVINIQSVRPTPTRSTTWGKLKNDYR